jgi:hypothetical protein
MLPPFDRLRAVPKIALATSPTAPCGFASLHQCAAQTTAKQDEVYRALTKRVRVLAVVRDYLADCRDRQGKFGYGLAARTVEAYEYRLGYLTVFRPDA